MSDWKAMAEAQGVPLTEAAAERLAALEKKMKGLRGLIDYTEEPDFTFDASAAEEPGA